MTLVGYVEACSRFFVSGWVVEPGKSEPIKILIKYDGFDVGSTFTGHHRPDVAEFHGTPRAGFYFSIPPIGGDFEPRKLTLSAAGKFKIPLIPGAVRREVILGKSYDADNTFTLPRRIEGQGNVDPELSRFKLHSEQAGMQIAEVFTDVRIKSNSEKYFGFKKELFQNVNVHEVSKLAPWMYDFQFANAKTSDFEHTYTYQSEHMHDLRSDLITQTIKDIYGDRLRDMTVLDIGCNCGIFSFDLASIGAKQVVGIDVFERNIKQAKYLNTILGYDNVEFRTCNLKNLNSETFDIVLNLGVMYHLSTPYEVMQLCHSIANELCVVDTICHKDVFSGFFSTYKPVKSARTEGDTIFELQPTYRAIIDLISLVRFNKTVELVSSDVTSMDLYKEAIRRCFLCFKTQHSPNLEAVESLRASALVGC